MLLPIRLLIAQKDCGNFNNAGVMVGCKNDTVPANTFPVPPLPLTASQGDDIPQKRIISHLPQTCANERLLIRWEASKLSFGVSRQPDVPSHVLNLQARRILRGVVVPHPF